MLQFGRGRARRLIGAPVDSALPPKADNCRHEYDVRFVPKADIAPRQRAFARNGTQFVASRILRGGDASTALARATATTALATLLGAATGGLTSVLATWLACPLLLGQFEAFRRPCSAKNPQTYGARDLNRRDTYTAACAVHKYGLGASRSAGLSPAIWMTGEFTMSAFPPEADIVQPSLMISCTDSLPSALLETTAEPRILMVRSEWSFGPCAGRGC